MNQRELLTARRKNFGRLDTMAYKPKINAIEIDINNTIEHEMAKFIAVYLIRNGVPTDIAKFCTIDCFDSWKSEKEYSMKLTIKNYGHKFKHEWERPQIVTEARMKDGRRADIFVLDSGEVIEIDNTNSPPMGKDEKRITIRI